MPGALAGIRIVEFAGIDPGPFAGMMFADHGAEVIRIERPGDGLVPHSLARGRRSIAVDLKSADGIALVRKLCATADGLIEGFRPGVMERLGLGPEALHADNPRLVYGRMTGWGQTGPLAHAPGHDINYIAVSGVLEGIGHPGGRPVAPVNYVGDFGGGGMMLVFGMVSALLAVRMGAPGQIVDAAMTDGSALLAAMSLGFKAAGMFPDGVGNGMLSGAASFYRTYECSDGKFVGVGAIEPQFWAALLSGLDLDDDPDFSHQRNPAAWPAQSAKLEALFARRTRDEWAAHFAPDACVSPVLTFDEAAAHPHNAARETFADGQPAPAPRFSATPGQAGPTRIVEATDAVLAELGYPPEHIARLRAEKTIA